MLPHRATHLCDAAAAAVVAAVFRRGRNATAMFLGVWVGIYRLGIVGRSLELL